MDNNIFFGFINVYKPAGITSHDVISHLRRISKIRQIGHCGTLDPFAEGVLPVAIGKSTRLIEFLNDEKAYIGQFCFGKSTDTYDKDGINTEIFNTKIDKKSLINVLSLFKGEIEQYPPAFSAKKINGKKAYELARAGIAVDLKPCKVIIRKIELLNFDDGQQSADIYIQCSKGTYIRSIANDIGKKLHNGCYLNKLKRVQSGLFKLDYAVKLDDLKTVDDIKNNMCNPLDYLLQKKLEIDTNEAEKVFHGMSITNKTCDDGTVVLTHKGLLLAIAEANGDKIKVKKVFMAD